MLLGIYLCIHTYIQYGSHCFIFILSWTISESEKRKACAPFSKSNLYHEMLPPSFSGILSKCSRWGTMHFMDVGFLSSFKASAFLIMPLLLLGFPAPLCLGANSIRVRGCQWCWGTMSGRWKSRAQAHHCCVCTPQHPPLPRWQPFTVWRIIL